MKTLWKLLVHQVVPTGGHLFDFAVGGRYYAVKPDDGPEWGLRFTVSFLLPK